jgi:hypothetical protein
MSKTYRNIVKTKEMVQVFKRKSGAFIKTKSRTAEEQGWKRELEKEMEETTNE